MKKNLIVIFLAIFTFQLFSIMGFGAHIGTDFIDIPELEESFTFDMSGMAVDYSVKRDAISNPISFGVQGYLDLPVFPIGFEFGASAAAQKYSWSAPNKLTTSLGEIPLDLGIGAENGEYKEDFIFGRLSADATAKYYFFKLPMLKLYVGGGAGLHFITPIISQELFIENLQNQTYDFNGSDPDEPEIDIEEIVRSNTSVGGHFVTGLRFKPWVIPLSINLDYKHTFTQVNDYEDDTNVFGNVKVSLNLYF